MVHDNEITTTDYTGDYIYENGSLKFFNQAEGYVEPDGKGGYAYVYQYKDHLGNVRLSYADSDGDGVVDVNEIIEELNYYPFGLKHRGYNNSVNGLPNKFLTYNGVEFEESLNLNMYEMDLRQYDPAIARWVLIDPLAEDMRRYSPYNYGFNNPVHYTDPDGMMPRGMGDIKDDHNFDFNIRDWKPYHASTYVDSYGTIIEHRNDGDPNIYLVLNPQNGLHQRWIIGTESPFRTYNVGDRLLRGDLNANYRNNSQALPSEFRLDIELADFESRRTDMVFWGMEFLEGGAIIKLNKYLKTLWLLKFGNRIKAKNLKEFKVLIRQLSKPGSELTKKELRQLEKLTKQFGGRLRYDRNPVKGKIKKPHVQVEGLGKSLESRHIWIKPGI